jgi:hypothetical protein
MDFVIVIQYYSSLWEEWFCTLLSKAYDIYDLHLEFVELNRQNIEKSVFQENVK